MNGATTRRTCEFQLLRYVPDAVRNEGVHIGVILRERAAEDQPARTEVRFTRDWRRVRCLDPDADTALLEGMESELRQRLQTGARGQADAHSRGVALAERADDRAQGVPGREHAGGNGRADAALCRVSAAGAAPKTERAGSDPGADARGVRTCRGVGAVAQENCRFAEYTRPGDPLRIDVGYRPNGVVRMFHAVSLEPGLGSSLGSGVGSGLEMAKVLAFSAASLRAGVERVEKAQLELTAVIEPAARVGATDEEPERLEMYRFGVETMEEHQIRVLTTSDMGRVAETARRELL